MAKATKLDQEELKFDDQGLGAIREEVLGNEKEEMGESEELKKKKVEAKKME